MGFFLDIFASSFRNIDLWTLAGQEGAHPVNIPGVVHGTIDFNMHAQTGTRRIHVLSGDAQQIGKVKKPPHWRG